MIEHYKNISLENIVEEIDGVIYTEEWKPIKGFEEYYSISNFGRVKSNKRIDVKKRKTGTIYKTITQEKILKHKFNNRKYHMVGFSVKNIKKYFTVHRLVGLHFIPNPNNKPQINHLFGDKKDNRMWMLEWNTNSENGLHSFRELGRKQTKIYLGKFGKDHNRSIPIRQYSIRGELIREWENQQQIQRELHFSGSNIGTACRGRYGHNQSDGYLWTFSKDNIKPIPSPSKKNRILQLSPNGETIQEYLSARKVNEIAGFDRKKISNAIKTNDFAYGFKWAYK